MNTCQSCGGSYEPVLADGMLYFHACPPLSVPELEAALAKGALQLNASAQAQHDAAVAADQKNPPAPGDASQVQRFLGTLTVARPNARNENVVSHDDPQADPVIVSEGAGVLVEETVSLQPAAAIVTP